ncbi:cytochrome c oxidase assembly protein [Pseudonocardia benzenivorans]
MCWWSSPPSATACWRGERTGGRGDVRSQGALAVAVVVLDGPVAVYGDLLFWVHMIAHLSLIMVVPVLVAWARPLALLRSAGPGGGRRWAQVLDSRAVRLVTFPLLTLAVYAVVVVLTHLTGFQQIAVEHPVVRGAETALYVVAGYLLFAPLIGDDAEPRRMPYLLRFVVLALAMGVDTLTGVVLMLTGTVLAPGYAAAHPGWGPGALADQGVAGAVMWWGGDGLMMLLLLVVVIRWGRAPAAEQGLGSFLEGVRRSTVLGQAGDRNADIDAAGIDLDGIDVDDDEAALVAYNQRLAALHGRPPRGEGGR